MNRLKSLGAIIDPVISLVPHTELRDSLYGAFSEEHAAVGKIEEFFGFLPSSAWSKELLRTFASSWKATHLKMLAIYGLSCRLQRLADAAAEPGRSTLYLAAARNAETSYEDLGLDFDGQTHADLYENFADTLTGDDLWQLRQYRLPEAHRFSRWVYRNMVVEPVVDGLLTNMFSEIYNHGEYSLALPAAETYFQQHAHLNVQECDKASTYIAVHVANETEADHFLVVVEALDSYLAASGTKFNATHASSLFRSYLRNIAPVMQRLTEMMHAEAALQVVTPMSASGGYAS